jgi:hypothetical protein
VRVLFHLHLLYACRQKHLDVYPDRR